MNCLTDVTILQYNISGIINFINISNRYRRKTSPSFNFDNIHLTVHVWEVTGIHNLNMMFEIGPFFGLFPLCNLATV